MGRVEGKIALVTGAAQGLGAATARRLADEGAALVVLTDRRPGPLAATAGEIAATGTEVLHLEQDVSKEEDWQRVMDAVMARSGGIDVLVNNAGTNRRSYIEDTSLKTWRFLMGVNLDSVFLGIRFAIGAMQPRAARWAGGGSIVNISSIAGLVGLAGSAPYCATKGGVRLLTKAAAVECARRGRRVRVNSVHPGYIETEGMGMALDAMAEAGMAESAASARETLTARHPIGRLGAPLDIANAVVYLASEDAAFVTGTELVVDGGYCAE